MELLSGSETESGQGNEENEQTRVEASEVKVVSRRPAKRRSTRTRKVTRKSGAEQGSETEAAVEEAAKGEASKEEEGVKVVSRRPAKRRTTRIRKAARKSDAEQGPETEAAVEEAAKGEASKEEEGVKVVSRRPDKRRTTRTRKAARKSDAEPAVQPESAEVAAETTPRSEAEQPPSQWGRRSRRAPSTQEVSSPQAGEVESPVSAVPESPAGPDTEGTAEGAGRDSPTQESRRARRRRPRRRRPDPRGGDEKGAEKEARSSAVRPSSTLAEVLAETWTEEKTRKFLSDGFIATLSPGLTSGGEAEAQPNAEALQEPLKGIRKVLADECMVEDDATDVMLLDMVMNALADRIEIYRLQAEKGKWEDIDLLLDLRYKADHRLIETIVALKNT